MLSIRDQCRKAKVPFFRILDGRTCDEMPPRVRHSVPDRKDRLAMIEEVQAAWNS